MNLDFLTGLVFGAAGGLALAFSTTLEIVKLHEAHERKRTKGKHVK